MDAPFLSLRLSLLTHDDPVEHTGQGYKRRFPEESAETLPEECEVFHIRTRPSSLIDHVITTMWKCLVLFLLSTSYVACAVPNEAGFIRGAQNVSGELGIIP